MPIIPYTAVNELYGSIITVQGVLVFVAAYFSLLFFKRNRPAPEKIVPEKNIEAPHSEAIHDVPTLIDTTPELSSLCEKLGYSPSIARHAHECLGELKSLIQANIIDMDAFREALQAVSSLVAQTLDENADSPQIEAFLQARDLYNQVVSAEDNYEEMLRLLNRDPVYERLPFIEQIPVCRGGGLTWRTPIEHTIIQKRPSDEDRFMALLDELEKLFSGAKVHQKTMIRIEVFESISRLRRDVGRDLAYLPTSIQVLEEKITEFVAYAPSKVAQVKRELLINLLEETLLTRQHHSDSSKDKTLLDSGSRRLYRDKIRQEVKKYIAARWMHLPWLTTFLLETLLDSEINEIPQMAQKLHKNPYGLLTLVRNEVGTGFYDCIETIRRLRQLEKHGLFVNSLAYGLLRLQNRMKIKVHNSGPVN